MHDHRQRDDHSEPYQMHIRLGLYSVVFLHIILTLLTFQDYGITSDDPDAIVHGRNAVAHYGNLLGLSESPEVPSRQNGSLFDLSANLVARILPLDIHTTRTLLTSAFAFVGILALYSLGTVLGGPRVGLLAAVLLLLTPRFYGHSFINPEDIALATGYLFTLLCVLRLNREFPNPRYVTLALTGLAIGLTLAVRVDPALILSLALLLLGTAVARSTDALGSPRGIIQLVGRLAVVSVVAYVAMLAFWPDAWSQPFHIPWQSLTTYPKSEWRHLNVFSGNYVDWMDVPRSFSLVWLGMTLPEVAFLGLIALVAASVIRQGYLGRRGLITVCLAVILPLLAIVTARLPLFHGSRHLLFLVPPIIALCSLGIVSLLGTARLKWQRHVIVAATALVTILPIREMIRLHPYQYTYFNHVSGTIDDTWTDYDTDYWQTSYKAGVNWILENGPMFEDRKTRVSALFFDGVFFQMESDNHEAVQAWEDPDVYLGTKRFGEHRALPGELLHTVKIGNAPALYIVRPDTSYADAPDVDSDPYLDQVRAKTLALAAARAENLADTSLALHHYQRYVGVATRLGVQKEADRARAKVIYLTVKDPERINEIGEALSRKGDFRTAGLLFEKLSNQYRRKKYLKNLKFQNLIKVQIITS